VTLAKIAECIYWQTDSQEVIGIQKLNKFCFEARQSNTANCIAVVISKNNGHALTALLTTISSSPYKQTNKYR
jgi:hypothetical protein